MQCPYCKHTLSSVLETRLSKKEGTIRRRRECTGCGLRYTTREVLQSDYRIMSKESLIFNKLVLLISSFVKEERRRKL